MTFNDLAGMFNRSWEQAFNVRKFIWMFLILIISGLILLFFHGMALVSSGWIQLALRFIPVFLAAALLMGLGITLMQRKVNGHPAPIGEVVRKVAYFMLPLIGAFLALWILLGLFILLKMIPFIGVFFAVILAFVPFLLTLATLLLLVAAVGALFFFTPVAALKQPMNRDDLTRRMKTDLFTHAITFIIAIIPAWIVWTFAKRAAMISFELFAITEHPLGMIFQAFFMLIPVAAVLAFPMLFFFNFALEVYLKLAGDNKLQTENASLGL